MSTIATAHMVMDRTTKGAVLYKNTSEKIGRAITTLYLRKGGLIQPYPSEIVVTIVKKNGDD